MAGRYFLLNNTPRKTSLKKERNFRISNLTEEEVIKEFRLKKSEIGYICSLLQDSISPFGFRSTNLSLEQKVLICLKTLESGSFQNCSKDFINVSQPTVSQVFSDFTDNLVRMAPNFIYMPSNSNEILRTKKEFYKVAGFPGVIGYINGSHISIIAPHQDEFAYVNRKKFNSVNIQGFAMLISCFLMSWLNGQDPAMILLFCKLLK